MSQIVSTLDIEGGVESIVNVGEITQLEFHSSSIAVNLILESTSSAGRVKL